jgi:hypothetical protein
LCNLFARFAILLFTLQREHARLVRKILATEDTESTEKNDKSLFKKELGEVKKIFKISIFRFWTMRAPCDVEKNYQEFTTEITEHTEENKIFNHGLTRIITDSVLV